MKNSLRSHIFVGLATIVSIGLGSGCSYLPKGVADLEVGVKERGTASWYGNDFDGRLTASGDLYDDDEFTGAHRTLPFGTVVKVTNAQNGRQVIVRINDRGPYLNGRILDLSYAAANTLGFISSGTTRVLLEVVTRDSERFQLGSWSGLSLSSARPKGERMAGRFTSQVRFLETLFPEENCKFHNPPRRWFMLGDLFPGRRLRWEADPQSSDTGDNMSESDLA